MALAHGNILCVIPARGGSKRVPQKNSRLLDGVPLIAYSIRSAKVANCFAKVVVSTDDPAITEIAISEGVAVDRRPPHLAGDTTTKVEVVHEYLTRVSSTEKFDSVAALLPTCPFRTADDVANAVALFEANPQNDFLVGVTEYEFPIQLALKDVGGDTVEMLSRDGYKTTRSQNIEKRYHPNGAIYLARVPAFLKSGTFFHEKMLAFKMPAQRSFDIDYPYQFEIAEIMMRRLRTNGKLD